MTPSDCFDSFLTGFFRFLGSVKHDLGLLFALHRTVSRPKAILPDLYIACSQEASTEATH